jgi:hypothetical protein
MEGRNGKRSRERRQEMNAYCEERHVGKEAMGLLLGPIAGLLYVVCLPFVAIAAVIVLVARKAAVSVAGLVKNLAYFGWRPLEAYLSGKKKKG